MNLCDGDGATGFDFCGNNEIVAPNYFMESTSGAVMATLSEFPTSSFTPLFYSSFYGKELYFLDEGTLEINSYI